MEGPYLQRDEQREPAQHVLRDLGHAVRVYAQTNVAIKHGLEVPCEAMQHSRVRYVEGKLGRAGVMTVGQRKPCNMPRQ